MTVPRKSVHKTPIDRHNEMQEYAATVKKRYKLNVRTKRRFEIVGEEDLVKDMVVVLKLANYTHTQIGAIVGVSRGQVKVYLQDEKVQKKLLHLREALPQAALELGRAYLIEAVQAVVHVLRTETDNALVLKAAAEMFDRFGLPKLTRTEAQVDETNRLGETDESLISKFRDVSPEFQEKAAQLHDAMEEGLKHLLDEAGKEKNGDSQ
jgi:hypothetical protein